MTCKWCPKEATHAGRAPAGTVGLLIAPTCDDHVFIIAKLGYTQMTAEELIMEERLLRLKEKAQRK